MACGIDTSKVKRNKLLDDLFFGNSSKFMRLTLFFSFSYFGIDFFHLSNVVVNKILFRILLIAKPLLDYFE